MGQIQLFPECVALLGDVVRSRDSDRAALHAAMLAAIAATNRRVPPLDPLRVTVGDEVQGVYPTLGAAVEAAWFLRDELLGSAEVRIGLGGGELRVIDAERGIQDGPAWWNAREAIERVETLAAKPGHRSARTAIVDARAASNPLTDSLLRLVDAHLAGLGEGTRRTWRDLRRGLSNLRAAEAEGVRPSAISQRINDNALRPLADVAAAVTALP